MILLLMTIALAGQSTDEWRPYTANPKYEVFGHEQEGVFRYTRSRLRVAEVKNFGVNLPEREPVIDSYDFEIVGTDKDLGEELAKSALMASLPSSGSAGPCPGPGPCPKPNRPTPRPAPHIPTPGIAGITEGTIVLILLCVLGASLGLLILAVKIVLLFLLCRWLYRKWSAAPNPE